MNASPSRPSALLSRRIATWLLGAAGLLVLARLIFVLVRSVGAGELTVHPTRLLLLAALSGGLFALALFLRRSKSGIPVPAPVWILLFLAPWTGEFLLGNIPITGIVSLPFLALLYGAGAVLIREIARRTGRGWPAILVLAAAYGVIEAGLVDQSLFNMSFEGHDAPNGMFVSALGINAYNAFAYVAGHMLWSIATPIALAELLTPARRTAPWLSKTGLAVIAGVYLAGCAVVFMFVHSEERFAASPAQLAGAAVVAALLVALAFVLPRNRPAATGNAWVPKPWLLGVGTFVAAGVFFAKSETWGGLVFAALLLAGALGVLAHWTRQRGWTSRHLLAVAGAMLLTYAWGGFVLTALFHGGNPLAFGGNALFALMAVVIVMAARRMTVKPHN
jgi:hypothetical protein